MTSEAPWTTVARKKKWHDTSRSPNFPRMEIANVFTDEWDDEQEHEGFRIREAQIGPRLDAELIGGSVYEIDPGKKLWPYHLHHANEEWLVVLRGRPMLRTPEGERELVVGDVACFIRGRHRSASGAKHHRGARAHPDALDADRSRNLEYPDSGKLDTVSAKGERILL